METVNNSRTSRWQIWVLCALLIYSVGLSVGPRVSGDMLKGQTRWGVNCLTAIDLPGPFGILLNCDSPDFMESASKPGRLLEAGNWRQNRPGQIWLAWLIAQPIGLFSDALVWIAKSDGVHLPEGRTRSRAQAIADLAPAYLAYYLINIALLVAAIWLLRSNAIVSGFNASIFVLTGAALMFNDITKAYLVTPHSQLMNILIPVLLGTLLFRWLRGDKIGLPGLLWLAALGGFGLLAYATWLLLPVIIGIGMLWSRFGQRPAAIQAAPGLYWFPVILLLVLLPYYLWYLYVINTTGSFYQHETTYDGGLVWVLKLTPFDALVQFLGNVEYLLGAAMRQCLPLAALMVPAIVVLLQHKPTIDIHTRRDLVAAVLSAVVVGGIYLGFFALLGFRIWRYAVPLLPAMTLPIAMLNAVADRQLRTAASKFRHRALLAAIGVGLAAFEIAKDGPWG